MKMKALAALCKKESTYILYNRETENAEKPQQWLGVRGAIYPLPELPPLSEEHIAALFDISVSQRERCDIGIDDFPDGIDGSDFCVGEKMLDPSYITIRYKERIVRPYMTRDGLEFVNDEYFKPLADVQDELEIYERRCNNGSIYFAAKIGFVLVGLIMPIRIDKELVDDMEMLAEQARVAFRLKKEREERQITAPGQMDLGELVDVDNDKEVQNGTDD